MKISTQMKTKWMQFKVSALSASVTALIVSGIPTQISASDIDIYQAGGTGEVNIKFMLDRSLSMGDGSSYGKVKEDYEYVTVACKSENKNVTDLYTNSPQYGAERKRYDIVDLSHGQYRQTNWGYEYVGVGNGNKSITLRNNQSSGGTRLYLKTQTRQICDRQIFCASTSTLPSNLVINGKLAHDPSRPNSLKDVSYVYAASGANYCSIDLNNATLLSSTNTEDKRYIKRIQETCENKPSKINEYYCLSRFSNLKKALYSLVLDETIDSTKNFALGVYSSGRDFTPLGFTKMDDPGKKKFLDKIDQIVLSGATPIAEGYNAAGNFFSRSNMPTHQNTKLSCTGNGVYFLTDGVPQSSANTFLTNNDSNSSFSPRPTKVNKSYFPEYWKSMAGYALALKNSTYKIKTATVGLGGEYYLGLNNLPKDGSFDCSLYESNQPNQQALCYLGAKATSGNSEVYGQGGFYTAQSADDLIQSIHQFVSDVSVKIEGSTMGTSTVPIDALNPTQLQSYSYFPMFKPIVGGDEQLWAGNLKKFAVKMSTGTVVDQSDKAVFKDGEIQERLRDYWYDANGSSEDDVYMAWGGLLSKLKVDHKPLVASGDFGFNRNVYLDISVNNGHDLKHAVNDILKGSATLNNKHYLYGLLGYSKLTQTDFNELASKSYTDQVSYLQTKTNTQDFQMGSVIHSTPIMLTQKGVFEEKDGEYGVSEREDYILAGTTQGLVQVVNADTGKEVFSFLPSEFLTRTHNSQEKGFAESLAMERFTTTNTDKFFYGVDGPWVAHTEYEYAFEGDKEIMTAKKQYAYGGLRMGGRSYYALDLTDLGKTSSKPKLLFAIKPDNHISGALSYMGESWSKPVVTYIPWKGQKKLAMIVGGGYDRKYESQDVTGTVKGNGIYIFAAEDYDTNTKAGSLLWWGSSNATNSTSSTKIDTMTHSIPSRVKAVDRNGDGITDHLYVGDLGGQVFRVDFNSKLGVSAVNTPLVQQAVKIADLNSSGKYPRRFYEAPTFTIHKDNNGKRFAMVTLASGDRSSPLSTETNYPTDYIVAIKDDTVTQTTVTAPIVITLNSMLDISSTSTFNKGTHKGWFYPLPKSSSKQVRGIEEGIAIDNDLYYSVFNPDASTATEDGADECTGGVTGKSIAYKFCLPYGDKSCFGTTTETNPEDIGDLGAGIIGLTFGAGRSTATNRTLIFNKDIDPKPPEYAVSDKLVPKRWFEYLPFNSGGD